MNGAQTFDRDQEIASLWPTLTRIANRLIRERRLPPVVQTEDLISAGAIGLCKAADSYLENLSSFRTYAGTRAYYSMLDYLRECDMIPVYLRRKLRAAGLEGPREVQSDETDFPGPTWDTSGRELEKTEAKVLVHQILAGLSDRERRIITENDLLGRDLRQIGSELGITEGRVSQIRAGAFRKLKEMISDQS